MAPLGLPVGSNRISAPAPQGEPPRWNFAELRPSRRSTPLETVSTSLTPAFRPSFLVAPYVQVKTREAVHRCQRTKSLSDLYEGMRTSSGCGAKCNLLEIMPGLSLSGTFQPMHIHHYCWRMACQEPLAKIYVQQEARAIPMRRSRLSQARLLPINQLVAMSVCGAQVTMCVFLITLIRSAIVRRPWPPRIDKCAQLLGVPPEFGSRRCVIGDSRRSSFTEHPVFGVKILARLPPYAASQILKFTRSPCSLYGLSPINAKKPYLASMMRMHHLWYDQRHVESTNAISLARYRRCFIARTQ